MALVRPTDLGSVVQSVNSICDQLERWARGEEQVVTNPQLRGELLAPSTVSTAALTAGGVTLGKLATSFSDAPPGYVVASGTFTTNKTIAYNTNVSEGTALQVVVSSSFVADGVRPVYVSFFASSWQSNSTGAAINELSLFDGGTSLGRFATSSFGVGSRYGPLAGATRVVPTAGTHSLGVYFWNSSPSGGADSAVILAGAGGPNNLLPGVLIVTVI